MSTRTHIVSLSNLNPIWDVIASGNTALVDAIMQRYRIDEYGDDDDIDDDDFEEFRECVDSMIACSSAPDVEPGCWNYVVTLLAAHFDLEPDDDFEFNEGWKHYDVWEPYRAMLSGRISVSADRALEHMQNGRPLRGSRVDHDGCVFGWLSTEEVLELHNALSAADKSLITDPDLVEFHNTLIEALKSIADRHAILFMASH